MLLTDDVIRTATTAGGPIKLDDGQGLYLLAHSDGARLWRWNYRRPENHRLHTLPLGAYPETTIAGARARRDALVKQLNSGLDPAAYQKPATRGQAIGELLGFMFALVLLAFIIRTVAM